MIGASLLLPGYARAASTRRLDLRQFGVAGDGVTDDGPAYTRALAAAAEHNRPLYHPGGMSCLIRTPVECSGPVALQGDGPASVIIGNTESTHEFFVLRGIRGISLRGISTALRSNGYILATDCHAIRIDNCRFDGAFPSDFAPFLVRFNGCTDVAVAGSTFLNFNNGLYFDAFNGVNSDQIRIGSSHFALDGRPSRYSSYPVAIYQYNCDTLSVEHCTFQDMFPGYLGVETPQGYCVYEGDGTAVSTTVRYCRYVTTKPRADTTFVFTGRGLHTVVSNNVCVATAPKGGGHLFQVGPSQSLDISDNTSIGFVIVVGNHRRVELATIARNEIRNAHFSADVPGIRIGAYSPSNGARTVNIRENTIDGIDGGGVMIDYCAGGATIADNLITDVNCAGAPYREGANESQVSGISFVHARTGVVFGNRVRNSQEGHACFGLSSSSPANLIVAKPDNAFSGMTIAQTLNVH